MVDRDLGDTGGAWEPLTFPLAISLIFLSCGERPYRKKSNRNLELIAHNFGRDASPTGSGHLRWSGWIWASGAMCLGKKQTVNVPPLGSAHWGRATC